MVVWTAWPATGTLNAQQKRLDKAIGLAWSQDLFIDEVNDGCSSCSELWLSGRTWTPPVCQALSSLPHEGEDCNRTSRLLMRHELAVPDEFCWSAPRSLTRTLGASSGAGYSNHGLTCRAINLLIA